MIVESYEFISSRGTKLIATSWQPTTPPIAVLFIIHGLGEHSGRYEELANTFVENQIAVFSFDHRGHGLSEGKRGHASSVIQLIEDSENALMQCRNAFLEIPIFLYGHSMGGQIAATFLKKVKSKEISGAIISSAWFELVSPPPSWQIKMICLLKKIAPNFTLSNKLDSGHISSVEQEVKLYENDDLVHDQLSFALFKALYNNGTFLLSQAWKAKGPVLICHGDKDQITSAEGSEQYAKLADSNVTFKIWEGAYHEPHHDFDKEKVIKFYVDWIVKNLP